MLLKGQIFGHGKRYFRRNQTFYHRVVCQVQEHGYVVGNAAFLKSMAEEISYVMFNAHGGKYDREFLIRVFSKRSLLYNLCSQLVVGQAVSGKDRKLLSADQCGQSVYSRDTGMDIVPRVFSADRI